MTRPVHIVALAARTPVGLRAESTAAAIRAGVSRVTLHPMFADAMGEPVRCGYDATLGPAVFGVDRLVALGQFALRQLIGDLTNRGARLGTVPLFLALPDPRPGLT